MVFRKIPAGTYTIGNDSTRTNVGRKNYTHTVKLPSDYYIAIFRLTQAQYSRITGSTSALTTKTVQLQTWNVMRGSAGVSAKPTSGPLYTMSSKTGLFVDLPTHAMYEVAIRSGETYKWVGGDTSANDTDYIWCTTNMDGKKGDAIDVGLLKPNKWGLYDVAGLYQGLCRDWCPAETSSVDAAEPALANNFMPISTGQSSYRLYVYNGDYAVGNNDLQLSMLGRNTNGSLSHRLAVYPEGYYPNGGK